MQCYEETAGLCVGDVVTRTKKASRFACLCTDHRQLHTLLSGCTDVLTKRLWRALIPWVGP